MPKKSRKSSRRRHSGTTPDEPIRDSQTAKLIAISKERRLQLRANLAALTNLMFKNVQLTTVQQTRIARKSGPATALRLSPDRQLFGEFGAAMNLFGTTSAELGEILADVHNDTVRVCEIVRDIHDLFAGETTRKAFVRVNEIVKNVVRTMSNEARLSHSSLIAGLSADVPEICADGAQVEHAITNLVWNGLEAMEDTHPRERSLVVSTRYEDGYVEISVSDKGDGIQPRAFPHLFETYFTTKPDRMGLGLAVSRSIAELHQGTITGENNSGRGATFRLRLPVDQTEDLAEPALRAVSAG